MFYSKLSVYQTGLQSGRAVLQLQPALELLHRGPVRQGVRMQKHQTTVHWVLLLGAV